MVEKNSCISVRDFNFYYTNYHALKSVNMNVLQNEVLAMIGPSGCGKSTFLRSVNRMNDLVEGARVEGLLEFKGNNVYGKTVDVSRLRREIGMVFQKPNPFPKSIFENVAYGLRVNRLFSNNADLNEKVEKNM